MIVLWTSTLLVCHHFAKIEMSPKPTNDTNDRHFITTYSLIFLLSLSPSLYQDDSSCLSFEGEQFVGKTAIFNKLVVSLSDIAKKTTPHSCVTIKEQPCMNLMYAFLCYVYLGLFFLRCDFIPVICFYIMYVFNCFLFLLTFLFLFFSPSLLPCYSHSPLNK